eukprot:g5852.t1
MKRTGAPTVATEVGLSLLALFGCLLLLQEKRKPNTIHWSVGASPSSVRARAHTQVQAHATLALALVLYAKAALLCTLVVLGGGTLGGMLALRVAYTSFRARGRSAVSLTYFGAALLVHAVALLVPTLGGSSPGLLTLTSAWAHGWPWAWPSPTPEALGVAALSA